VNPLTQRSETLPSTDTSTLPQAKHRKRGVQAFEKTHERITLWLDSDLKRRFEALADGQGVAKSTLLDEAVSDLLAKYEHPKVAIAAAHVATMENEIEQLHSRLDVEEMYRTDTRSHHFKKWLRTHDHPEGTDFFFKRFLADGQLPEHASRALYEAKLRAAGYPNEDLYLFQDAWKAMLVTNEWK
jgi:predicted transcriptional regulator